MECRRSLKRFLCAKMFLGRIGILRGERGALEVIDGLGLAKKSLYARSRERVLATPSLLTNFIQSSNLQLQVHHDRASHVKNNSSTLTFHTIRDFSYSFYSNCILPPCRQPPSVGSCQQRLGTRLPQQTNFEASMRSLRSPRETASLKLSSIRFIISTPLQLPN